MQKLNVLARKFGKLLYPNVCLRCDDVGHDGFDLCERCHQNLPWIKNACQHCALPLITKSAKCGACSNRTLYFDGAFAPFLFEEFIREVIHEFKFNNKLNYGRLLSQLLINSIKQQNLSAPDVFIPVPLHKKRLQKRGFNQALEITRALSKYFSRPFCTTGIQRVRNTNIQMELPAKYRQANVKNAFVIQKSFTFQNAKHAVIIDDVMTTGCTVNELAKCVKRTGIKRIEVWCVARVP